MRLLLAGYFLLPRYRFGEPEVWWQSAIAASYCDRVCYWLLTCDVFISWGIPDFGARCVKYEVASSH